MFCNETIMHVYERHYYGDKAQPWHNAILRLTGNFEYHATDGYWLVFQTEHFIISLGFDGVKKYNTMEEFCPENELDPLSQIDDWVTTEETLFVGEHICSVDDTGDCLNVTFDHFSLRLYSYDESNSEDICKYSNSTNDYIPLAVGKHLLNRKCACGGEGEICLDFVSDYFVHCNRCHNSTWAEMCLIDAIDAWNKADLIPLE